jgi:hypothetical protein
MPNRKLREAEYRATAAASTDTRYLRKSSFANCEFSGAITLPVVTREQLIVLAFIAGAYIAGWITAALLGAVTRRRTRAAAPEPAGPVDAAPAVLVEEVADALEDDAANESMLSVFRADPAAELTELELDLADWGFTYGVAWERARAQEPWDSPDAVAAEALRTADEVFRAYTDGAGPARD